MNPRRLLLLQGLSALALPGVAAPLRWPEIELIDGQVWPATHWQDRAAVLVFFESSCPFCRRHNAHVEKLHQRAAGLRLQVLGAALDRDPEALRAYLRRAGYSFPVTLQGARLRALISQRQVVPLTVTVDRKGLVRAVVPGEMFEEDLLELTALAEG